ncbi:MAG: flagellar basal body L-ring protein FlgH [Desulfobacteraceae bacterium]|nr:flagellar basal body L-ring protein FlgH [Desulfobacteraceae bacterium]
MKFKFNFIILIIFLFSLGMLVTGCTFVGNQNRSGLALPPGGSIEPALPINYAASRREEGSLWTKNERYLFEDTRAKYVGDTVIVDIVENSTSKMDVNTESARKTSMTVGTPTVNILGFETNLGGTAGTNLLSTDFSNTFSGEAASDRTGQVTASIAARVTETLPNGNLSIFGRRAMKVDNEVQYIVVSGIIRPQDISSTNRVQSTFLADSRIEYYGKGALADKQKPGWGTRLIDNLWPW